MRHQLHMFLVAIFLGVGALVFIVLPRIPPSAPIEPVMGPTQTGTVHKIREAIGTLQLVDIETAPGREDVIVCPNNAKIEVGQKIQFRRVVYISAEGLQTMNVLLE